MKQDPKKTYQPKSSNMLKLKSYLIKKGNDGKRN
jgi:hypothetical protein